MSSPALPQVLADLVLAVHAGFALFVVVGGWLVLRWRALIGCHAPAVLWGIAIELTGWTCPLTPLENRLRAAAGDSTYGGDFIQHYLTAALYPAGLTRPIQLGLAASVLLINFTAYRLVWRKYAGVGR